MSQPIAPETKDTAPAPSETSNNTTTAKEAPKPTFLARVRELGAKIGQWFKENARVLLLSALAVAAVVTAAIFLPVIIVPLVTVAVAAAGVYGIWALASFVMSRFFKGTAKEDKSVEAAQSAEQTPGSTQAINSKLGANPAAANDADAAATATSTKENEAIVKEEPAAEVVSSISMGF